MGRQCGHGKKIADALDDLDLTLINTQYAYGSPTFRDISVLDVAMTNDLSLVSDLVIGDELVGDGHRLISVTLTPLTAPLTATHTTRTDWDMKTADWQMFEQHAERAGAPASPLRREIERADAR